MIWCGVTNIEVGISEISGGVSACHLANDWAKIAMYCMYDNRRHGFVQVPQANCNVTQTL